ncbi:MAG: hypothetical protein BZY82_06950 [SAR202 cluster bacterium Io17-Chloro-G3]|nr:MAG: hypothetical protein BZY82_06950 [SAR202 cluster bacterium Io17-Chloro-G3]
MFLQRNTPAFEGLNPFEIPDILTAAVSMTAFAVTWTSIGIFAGAAGKSGQFPLHTWLPDAMEGPTPVSSLIHAATMVAAGVFLVVRFFDLFAESSVALMTVALVGGFTAVFAATMGLVMFDIKRVLAYSTVSQLGYMMLAIGIGAPAVAMFHLFTHAFFKCLLFLGAGSVNHATGTFDMRYMGGLRSAMPWTYWTFVVAALSLAGIFPLAGFWSKDEILLSAWRGVDGVDTVVFSLAFIGVFLTAFYMYRVVSMTFHGEFKGGIEKELEGQNEQINGPEVHVGESPVVMVVPLVILAGASLVAGYLVNPISSIGGIPPHWFTEFLGGHSQGISLGVAFFSTATALAGIVASYMWGRMPLSNLSNIINPLRTLMLNKYYLDVLYEHIVVKKLFYQRITRITDRFDANVIDRFVDFLGWIGRNIGKAIAPIQNGQVQVYGIIILLGVAVIIGTYLIVEN